MSSAFASFSFSCSVHNSLRIPWVTEALGKLISFHEQQHVDARDADIPTPWVTGCQTDCQAWVLAGEGNAWRSLRREMKGMRAGWLMPNREIGRDTFPFHLVTNSLNKGTIKAGNKRCS
jgi:hypothetical protein